MASKSERDVPSEGDTVVSTSAPVDAFKTLPPRGADEHVTLPPQGAHASPVPKPVDLSGGWRAEDLIGCGVGPWVVEALLGEGGWGAVFRARRRDDPAQRAALKIPKPGDSASAAERLGRFQLEIRALAKIHAGEPSPHVVRLLGAEPEGDPLPWLALELIDGVDLQELLQRRRKLPIAEALTLALGVLAGLRDAHRAGVVHRDLKPANVLTTPEGGVYLADFGIARRVAREGQTVTVASFGLTATGQAVGTVNYMSPEAIEAGAVPVEEPGDLYSFGCLLYCLVAGRTPFRGSLLQVYSAHFFEEPAALSDFVAGVPAGLDALVAALLAKAPADRPSLPDTEARLRALLTELARDATPPPPPAPVAVELQPGDEVEDERSGERYRVERELGRGGMGIVYGVEAEDGRELALKVAGFNFATQEQARAQLIRDAENAIRVGQNEPHPAVARVHRVGTAIVRKAPIVFLISERVDGPSLAQRIEQLGPIDDELARDLWIRTAEGLSSIHDAGVLHLDLTPGNILVEGWPAPDAPSGGARPKIVDFGISKRIESHTIREVEGNPGYMSPEQCEGLPPTFASDIYMLGATFYHATTGRPVFSGDMLAVLNQHKTAAPRQADLETPIGHDLALVLHKCLFKDAGDRYAGATELIEDLRRVGDSSFPRARLKAEWARERQRLAERGRIRPWQMVAGLVGFALLAALVVFLVQRGQAAAQIANLDGRIEKADASALVDLHGQVETVRAFDPEEAGRLERALEARADALLDDLGQQLRVDLRACGASPSAVRDRLRARRALLQDLRKAAPSVRPKEARLGALEGEVVFLEALSGLALARKESRWDDVEAALKALPPGPPHAKAARTAVHDGARGAIETLDGAFRRASLAVSRALQAGRYQAAQQGLADFAVAHPFAGRGWIRSEYATLKRTLTQERTKNPLEQAAEERHARELGDLRLEALLAAKPGSVQAKRGALARAIERLAAFLELTVRHAGESRSVRATKIGRAVEDERKRATATYAAWASHAWRKLEAELGRLAKLPPSPQAFARQEAAWRSFPRAWAQPYPKAPAVWITPGAQGGRARLKDLLAAERERLTRAIAASAEALTLEAETALRAYDLPKAERASAQVRAFRSSKRTEAAFGLVAERVALVEEQRALFAKLDAEERAVRLPGPNGRLGAEGEAYWKLRPLPVELQNKRLQVGRYEVRVKVYRLFLKVVRRGHASLRAAKLCHPSEPAGATHEPQRWTEQGRHDERPVVGVTWHDAWACAAWAGRRLPSREAWEVLARGPKRDRDRRQRWRGGTHPQRVGASGEQNGYGLFDTAGNVAEWTRTRHTSSGEPWYCGPHFGTADTSRVPHELFRALHAPADTRRPTVGFRMVRDP